MKLVVNIAMLLISQRKILAINALVLSGLWFLIEAFFYITNPLSEESNRITCNYDWVLYNYCPNIVDVTINTKADGGKVVQTFSDEKGQRVRAKESVANGKAQHFFIGDSFIQADEIDYDVTFYGLLERKFNVSAIGYSSWNIIQYKDAVTMIAAEKVTYHVFIMTNDVIPSYDRSVHQELKQKPNKKLNTNIPSGFAAQINKFYSLSLFKKIKKFINNIGEGDHTVPTIIGNNFSYQLRNDCTALNNLPPLYKDKKNPSVAIGYDYLVYAKDPRCWSKLHTKAALQATQELKKLHSAVKDLNSELILYMIPPGWSFPNQNTGGRKENQFYFFDDSMEITSEPLADFLRASMPNVPFVNLEKILKAENNKCGFCKDLYYSSDDGHWTSHTHEFLANFIGSGLRQ